MVDAGKAFTDVTLDNPVVACAEGKILCSLQRHGCVPHRTETAGVGKELRFKNRLQYNPHALLFNPAPYRGNPQRVFFRLS